MEIRRARPSDRDIVAVLFDAYRQFYDQPANPALARQFIGERLDRDESVIYLAVVDGSAVGFVQLYPVFSSTAARPGRLWLLNDLFVTAAARRHGAARALMERAKEHAQETQAVGLFLQTARDNHPAQALYRSLGYRRDDTFLVYELATRA